VPVQVPEQCLDPETGRPLAQGMRREIVGLGHPQWRRESPGQPVRVPGVIRMQVGDNHASDRATADELLQHLLPEPAGRLVTQSGVDQHEAGIVFQQPQVDVVQCEGQRHLQPVHARRNLAGCARLWWSGPRVVEFLRWLAHDAGSARGSGGCALPVFSIKC
jgi:hypothetical protein